MGTTIHDIAKLTGFNASTVSRALRHDPRISSATVETVARAAKKLGYVINLTARNLAAGKTGLVALIMDCPENRHQAYPASIMNEILSEHDYSLMILLHNMTRQSLSNCISKLEQKICDAAVMIPPPETLFDSPLIARLNCLEMPFCYIDRWLEHTDYPAITTDVECSIRNLMDCILREKIDGALLYQSAYNTVGRARFLCESRLLTKLNIPWTEHPDELHSFVKSNKVGTLAIFADSPWIPETISDVLQGKNAGEAVKNDHSAWYIQMWMPFAAVGILQREDLVGYRTGQVYIRGSQHIPLNPKAVRDAMPVLFDLLKSEPHPAVRAVLGHFFFVFIHPYMDGNGRMGRFILNVMLASGGYNWTVIPVERRLEYMKALEKASVKGDISDFTKVIASLVK